MKDVSEINRNAYNRLAEIYNKNWKKYLGDETKVLQPFENCLHKTFAGEIRILDIGCGTGTNSYLLSEHGFDVTGIDFAENMINFSKINAPKAKFIKGDFLKYAPKVEFHGVVAMAFIHLFPRESADKIIDKISSLLAKNGLGLFVITVSKVSKEGFCEKTEYGMSIKRFRKYWTRKEFLSLLSKRFRILEVFEDADSIYDKRWLNIIAQKRPQNKEVY